MNGLGIYFVDEIPMAPKIIGAYGNYDEETYPCEHSILIKKGIPKIIMLFVLIHELNHHLERLMFKLFYNRLKIFRGNQKLRLKFYRAFALEGKITMLICRKWM